MSAYLFHFAISSFNVAHKSALQPLASVCLPWPIYGVGVNDTKMIEIMIRWHKSQPNRQIEEMLRKMEDSEYYVTELYRHPAKGRPELIDNILFDCSSFSNILRIENLNNNFIALAVKT